MRSSERQSQWVPPNERNDLAQGLVTRLPHRSESPKLLPMRLDEVAREMNKSILLTPVDFESLVVGVSQHTWFDILNLRPTIAFRHFGFVP